MKRYRLLDEIMPELEKIDPHTAWTRNAIRQKGLSGELPTIQCGRRRLYDLDAVLDYTAPKIHTVSGIRRIDEKAG